MQLQQMVECAIQARAVLADDGTCRITLTASMPYGPAHDRRSVSISLGDEEMDHEAMEVIHQALMDLRDHYASECLRRAQVAAHEAEGIAQRRGEYLHG